MRHTSACPVIVAATAILVAVQPIPAAENDTSPATPTARVTAPWDAEAVYAARVAELKAAIDARPKEAQPLVDLAAFYLRPTAPRDVEAADGVVRRVHVPLKPQRRNSIQQNFSAPWVWWGDPDLAKPLLERALTIDRAHPGAIRGTVMYLRIKESFDGLRPYLDAAMKNDPDDLEMCHIYLDRMNCVAAEFDSQANYLRAPRSWDETRADGEYRVTVYPSQADLAKADQLHAQAQDARRQAIVPLRTLVGKLKDDPTREATPEKNARYQMGSAFYYCWIGKEQASIGAAARALIIDPTNVDALQYLVTYISPNEPKQHEYKAVLDRWMGRDSTMVVIPEKGRPGARR